MRNKKYAMMFIQNCLIYITIGSFIIAMFDNKLVNVRRNRNKNGKGNIFIMLIVTPEIVYDGK